MDMLNIKSEFGVAAAIEAKRIAEKYDYSIAAVPQKEWFGERGHYAVYVQAHFCDHAAGTKGKRENRGRLNGAYTGKHYAEHLQPRCRELRIRTNRPDSGRHVREVFLIPVAVIATDSKSV